MRILQNSPFQETLNPITPQRTNAKEQWQKFVDKFQLAVDEVDCLGKDSEKMTQDFVLGRVENLHDVMIAAEKAKTAMNLTLEVRGKVLESYKEIMRMQF
jgi:flagellar hook-basal body complex protein FliE